MKIPLIDLSSHHKQFSADFVRVFEQLLKNSRFIGGNTVDKFEKDFARFCGVSYACGVASGTDALFLALKALNIGDGDEVIVPNITFTATAEAVINVGAKPVFVDIEPLYYTISTRGIKEAINRKTKAIIPVHLFGHPADMDVIVAIGKRYKLAIIEDCAQAHGTYYKNKHVGSMGDIGIFSFYPSKTLGALGDGGIVLSGNEKIIGQNASLENCL